MNIGSIMAKQNVSFLMKTMFPNCVQITWVFLFVEMVVPKNIKAFHHSDYILIYVLSAEGLAFKLIVSSFPRLLHNFCSNGESFLSLYWELSRYLKLCSILSFTASLT